MKVSAIICTRNESENIAKLLPQIMPYGYEVVVVDDSSDDTAEVAKSLGARVIKGRGLGLAQAVLDGIHQTENEFIIFCDADGQHPASLLPEVVKKLNYYDLVTVTKHNKESEAELSPWRKLQSNLGVWTAQALIPAPVSDPMTGFVGVRRKCLEGVELEAIGFKIGLEIIVKAKWVSHYDLPMKFGKREFGESKGTAHSLHKHIYRLWQYHLDYKMELPKGSEEYYNFYEGNEWQQNWKQSIALALQNTTKDIKPQKLLDAGCGSSPNLGYMHGVEKVGMDVRKEALDYMRSHCEASFVEGSVLNIPYPKESFDTIACIEVLEHLYPDEVSKALSEIVRVLQPNGYAILATPNYASPLWNFVETAQQFLQPGKWTSDHHTKFNRQSLKELCATYGLKEIRYDGVMANMDMIATYQKD